MRSFNGDFPPWKCNGRQRRRGERRRHPLGNKPWKEELHHQERALDKKLKEKTSSIKCFKCLGRGHITSQCPTKKTMIMRCQDIYSSQDEATTSPSLVKVKKQKGKNLVNKSTPKKMDHH